VNNIPNYYNNIDLILDEIWSLLQRGVADRNEDFRLPVVIVSATDSAEGRIVVLRGAFKDKNILRFHTDFRSSKIKSLKENKKIYFVFYNKKRKIQVRAEVENATSRHKHLVILLMIQPQIYQRIWAMRYQLMNKVKWVIKIFALLRVKLKVLNGFI